jgi:hypothetical protein
MLFFSTFPGGWPGLGLVLLRAAVGITAGIQGIAYLADINRQSVWSWGIGFLAVASGVLLLIGFLTSLTSIATGLGSLGVALSWFPLPAINFFDIRLAGFFVAIISAAIFLLGPGAFSLDAHLFGRREIIIPRNPNSPKA